MLADISQKRSYTIRRKKDRRLRYSLRAAIPAAVVEMVCDTIMIPGGARPVKCPAFYGGKPPRRTCVACSGGPSARKKRAATARRHGVCCKETPKRVKKQKPLQQGLLTENLAPPAGFEPVACRLGVRRTISHVVHIISSRVVSSQIVLPGGRSICTNSPEICCLTTAFQMSY